MPADPGSALANGAPGRTLAPLAIAPADTQPPHITAVVTGLRRDAHGAIRRLVREANPGQPVAARPDESPADLPEQPGFVVRARERTLAVDEHPQLAIGLDERR